LFQDCCFTFLVKNVNANKLKLKAFASYTTHYLLPASLLARYAFCARLLNANMSQAGTPSRNPRRRRRAEAEEGGSIRQQPQRKRTRLLTDAQQVLAEAEAEEETRRSTKHVQEDRSSSSRELVTRTKQHAAAHKKGHKDDGASLLVQDVLQTRLIRD
jgi:hypothetical protein